MVDGSVETVLRALSRAPDPASLCAATQQALASVTGADETMLSVVPLDDGSSTPQRAAADPVSTSTSSNLDLIVHHSRRHATILRCRRNGQDLGGHELSLARRMLPGVQAVWVAMSHRQQTLRLARLIASGGARADIGVILIGHFDIDVLELTDSAVSAIRGHRGKLCAGAAIPEPLRGVLQEVRRATAAGSSRRLSHVLSGSAVHVHPADPGFGGEIVLVETQSSSPLTKRQQQVMALVHEGCSNKEIAAQLAISIATVKKHLQSVYSALGVTSRTAALRQLSVGGASMS